jgi:choline-sulfatase
MCEFADTIELARELGPGETSYTQYDRDITSTAIDWLGRHNQASTRPLVLYVSYICPHYPLSAPKQFFDLYRDIELPAAYDCDASTRLQHPVIDAMREFWDYADYFDPDTEKLGLQNYYGLCSFLDDNVARMLNALEKSGQADNTQIIYTSDHGDLIGNHGIWGKSFMYEDSVGIPLSITGPGIDASVNQTPVSLTDLASTIELAVGAEVSQGKSAWQGRPLQSFIESPEPGRAVISEYHDGGSPCGFYMLRKGQLKLVYFADGNPPLLFDLQQDPQELINLADQPEHAQSLQHMTQELYQILDPQAVNDLAFADQARMIKLLGGMENILAMPSFNHTPLDRA